MRTRVHLPPAARVRDHVMRTNYVARQMSAEVLQCRMSVLTFLLVLVCAAQAFVHLSMDHFKIIIDCRLDVVRSSFQQLPVLCAGDEQGGM